MAIMTNIINYRSAMMIILSLTLLIMVSAGCSDKGNDPRRSGSEGAIEQTGSSSNINNEEAPIEGGGDGTEIAVEPVDAPVDTGSAQSENDDAVTPVEPADQSGANDSSQGDGEPLGQQGQQDQQIQDEAIHVVANAQDIAVLVNKTLRLPEEYKPDDLVEPDVPFIFEEKVEKRKMRKEAAEALEELFAAARADDVHLAGASGYRSQVTQTTLFNNYVNKDGIEAANRYSAKPGHSEHQTGLAMDVSGSTGKCAVEDCFADTLEAKWLAKHVAGYGFIIRYPQGKEAITGYKYEPWHLRYVGKQVSVEITAAGITLEEYYDQAIPVSNGK